MYPITVLNSNVPFRNFIEEFFSESAWPEVFGETGARRFFPALDLQEDETTYQLQVELPGLSKEDVKISLNGRVLTIQGEKKSSHEENREGVLRIERNYGNFQRRIQLPQAVAMEGSHAEMKDGVLYLRLPKQQQQVEMRQIPIN
jgi:HSP20 family protein